MDTTILWTLATVGGPIVLIVVIAYALIRRRKLSPGERSAQIRGTERGYSEPEENG